MGKLAASLAHEIRNPLSVIQLNLELLKTADKKEEVDESIDGCLSAAKRIQTLIETTLDFSRTQSTERSPHNLNDIIKTASDILSVKVNAAKIKLSKDLDQALPPININKNKILQVILNLITNSIEAIGSCGEIKIRTYLEKSGNCESSEIEAQCSSSIILQTERPRPVPFFLFVKKSVNIFSFRSSLMPPPLSSTIITTDSQFPLFSR
ncbi:MAG TPA: histidine kinase dimerization/phospho-acceptor domain-containing protein [Ignavibacteriales bacterium]|nr:histidine kinase dimerization/phospho-acceptor domain-containing protein [Ignavibacteriales bacterium]